MHRLLLLSGILSHRRHEGTSYASCKNHGLSWKRKAVTGRPEGTKIFVSETEEQTKLLQWCAESHVENNDNHSGYHRIQKSYRKIDCEGNFCNGFSENQNLVEITKKRVEDCIEGKPCDGCKNNPAKDLFVIRFGGNVAELMRNETDKQADQKLDHKGDRSFHNVDRIDQICNGKSDGSADSAVQDL